MPDIRNEIIDNLQIRGTIRGGGFSALAKAISVAMTSATSGSNGIQAADNANLDMGTNDFTLSARLSREDFVQAGATQYLVSKYTADPGVIFSTETDGTLRVRFASTNYFSTSVISVPDGGTAEFVVSVTREKSTTAGSVVFYQNGLPLGAPVAVTAASPVSVDNSAGLQIGGLVAIRNAGYYMDAKIYNRALSAAEVLSLYNNGPALADIGASQALLTNTESSTFEGGTVGSWIANSSGATVSVNSTTPISGVYDLSITSTGSGTSGGCIPISLINGKQYRIVFSYKAASGAWIPSIRDTTSASSAVPATIVSSPTITADGTVRQAVYVFTATATQTAYLHVRKSSETSLDTIYLDNFEARQIGITGWWDARDAQSDTGQILDSSGNKNHAMLPASGATVIGKPMSEARQVRWTNTWTGTQELQYIGGVNQAVLPAKAYIESIVGIVSGATVEDIIIGDGSSGNRYVTITTGLAAGTVTFTLANRTTDGTNLKLTVDPDASATMSIIWTVTYRILE